jgi:hypothetical protein
MGLANAEGKVTGNLLNVAGATSGIFQAGAAINVVLTAIVLDRYGRKSGVYYNAVIGLFGGALIVGAQNISMFLAGRFFAGMSSFGFFDDDPSVHDGAKSSEISRILCWVERRVHWHWLQPRCLDRCGF